MKKIVSFLANGLSGLWKRPSGQIGALDGLRSMAILLVMATHGAEIFLGAGGRASRATDFPLVRGGWVGVDLFFVLSGFFIGKMLWKEFRAAGTIDFKSFFLRRGMRIWPLYAAVLGLSILYRWATATPFTDLKPELFFYSNYVRGTYVGGSWSLATEEQFYLAVPLLIMAAGMFTKSLRTCLYGLLALFALEPAARALTWALAGPSAAAHGALVMDRLYFPFHTHCDGLIAGLILSNVTVDKGAARPLPMRYPRLLLAGGVLIAAVLRKASPEYFDYMGVAIVFAALTWYVLTMPDSLAGRALSWGGFFTISRLSYGMYLIHQPVGIPIARWLAPRLAGLPAAAQFPLVMAAMTAGAMAAAAMGFVLVEQPFLRLRSRLDSLQRRPKPAADPAPALVLPGAEPE